MAGPSYDKLYATTVEFINSTDANPDTGSMDPERILAIRSPDFKHDYGHVYFKTHIRPVLNKVIDRQGFLEHLNMMVPHLKSHQTKIQSIMVDTNERKATARVSYFMTPKGVEESVENEMIWVIAMNEEGDRVTYATEFLDGHAAQRIGELMVEGKKNLSA